MTTEGTYQKAQLLSSHTHVHISHEGPSRDPAWESRLEGHLAESLPCNVHTAFMCFSDAVSEETVILEAIYLPLMSLQ